MEKQKKELQKNNPPTIEKIWPHLRGQRIMREDMKEIISTLSGKNCMEIKKITPYVNADRNKGLRQIH